MLFRSATPVFGSAPQPYYGPSAGIYSGGGGGGCRPGNGNAAGSGGPGGGGAGGRGDPAGAGTDGADQSGGGGGGAGEEGAVGGPSGKGGDGGDGVVLVREVSVVTAAPGIWTMSDVFANQKAGTWTN